MESSCPGYWQTMFFDWTCSAQNC